MGAGILILLAAAVYIYRYKDRSMYGYPCYRCNGTVHREGKRWVCLDCGNKFS